MKHFLHHENLKFLFLTSLFIFVLFLLLFINNLLVSLVLAFVVFYSLAPLINWCERRGFNRSFSIFVIYTLNAMIVVGAITLFIPLVLEQLTLLEKELPELQEGVLKLMSRLEASLQKILHFDAPLFRDRIRDWMIDQTSEYSARLPGLVSDSLTIFFLTPFLAFFMLRDGFRIKQNILELTPNKYFERTIKLFFDMNEQIGAFIRARLAEALIVGLVTWVGLLIIGFPYAALLALFASLTNLIPYIGPIFGAVPAFIIIFVNPSLLFESLGLSVLALTIVYLTAHLLDAIVIIPMVVAKIVNLHPVTVILVIILGAQVLGIVGMIISIPMASLMKLLFFSFYPKNLSHLKS